MKYLFLRLLSIFYGMLAGLRNELFNLKLLSSLSQKRINADPTFIQIQEKAEYFKKKNENKTVSLNVVKYKKEQDEINANSKKLDELMTKNVLLEMANPPADMEKVNSDSVTIAKNKDWLKKKSKDIHISETVNILNDLQKSGMKVNLGTGMK